MPIDIIRRHPKHRYTLWFMWNIPNNFGWCVIIVQSIPFLNGKVQFAACTSIEKLCFLP